MKYFILQIVVMSINLSIIFTFIFLISGRLSDEVDQSNPKISIEWPEPHQDFWKSNVSGIKGPSLVSDNQTTNYYFFVNMKDKVGSYPSMHSSDCPDGSRRLGEPCQYHKDCRNNPYSYCSNGKCFCESGYFPVGGKCFAFLEKLCEEDSDCGVANSICKSVFCECMDGFYSTNDRKCYKFAEVPGDECGSDEGCQGVKYSMCLQEKCSCISNHFAKDGKCVGLLKEACEENSDCGVPNSLCESESCGCMTNFYSTNTSKCIPFAKVPGDVCGSDRGCRNVKYSLCLQEKCSCKANYFAKDGNCRGLLNEACEESSDCGVPNSLCESGSCKCMRGFYSTNNSKCIPFAKVPGDVCGSDRGCRDVKYSMCLDGKCSCKANYFAKDGTCRGLLNEACEESPDCGVRDSLCESGSCKCMTDFYSTNNRKCLEFAKGIGDFCGSDRGCKNVKYSTCSGDKCQCSSGYRLQGTSCLARLNSTCSSNQECMIRGSVCHQNTCQCPFGNYDWECYIHVTTLNDYCSDMYLCKVPYATCSDKKCKCPSNYIGFNNKCYGLEKAVCSSPSDCFSTSLSCVSGICEESEFFKEGKQQWSSKPGVSLYWFVENVKEYDSSNIVFAGMDGDTVVSVCRQAYSSYTVPGKLLKPKDGVVVCSIVDQGKEALTTPTYQKLVGPRLEWKDSSVMLDRAVYGGYGTDDKPYLICRTKHTEGANQTIVGRLKYPLFNSCISAYDSKVYNYDKFDVLVHK